MALTTQAKNKLALMDAISNSSLEEMFTKGLDTSLPYETISDFVMHPYFLGYKPFPRQLTLIKLIYLATEEMTQYDIDVINEWAQGFGKNPSVGVQPDIWERIRILKERGYRCFPHIINVSGRRAGKGWIGGVLGAEKATHLISLNNPQEYYDIDPNKDIYAAMIATSSTQAKKNIFGDVRNAIMSCDYLKKYISSSSDQKIYLRTPADILKIADQYSRGIKADSEVASIRFVAMASNSTSGRGQAGIMNVYDEFAHLLTGTGSVQSSEEIYEAYQPSLDQFGEDSLTYIPSSPLTRVGKFYELYEAGSILFSDYNEETGTYETSEYDESDLVDSFDPETLVLQLPSWEIYRDWEHTFDLLGYRKKRAPSYSPVGPLNENKRAAKMQLKDPERFAVERGAQFADVLNAYLDPKAVEDIFKKPDWMPEELSDQSYGKLKYKYHIHLDPSKVNANFAMSICHLETDVPADEDGIVWPRVVVDKLHVWKPEDYSDHNIPYDKVYQELVAIIKRFPTTEVITFDQFNSVFFIQKLKKEFPHIAVEELTFTKTENDNRFEQFKSVLNLRWIHSYADKMFGKGLSLLEQELKFLQKDKNGRIDKPSFGPVTTKDLADTIMVNTTRLLREHLEKFEIMLEGGSDVIKGAHSPAIEMQQMRNGGLDIEIPQVSVSRRYGSPSGGGFRSGRPTNWQRKMRR